MWIFITITQGLLKYFWELDEMFAEKYDTFTVTECFVQIFMFEQYQTD